MNYGKLLGLKKMVHISMKKQKELQKKL